jgi:hypothetical protein
LRHVFRNALVGHPTSFSLVPCGSPDPSFEPDRNGPHPSVEGRGAFWVAVRDGECVGVVRVKVSEVGGDGKKEEGININRCCG